MKLVKDFPFDDFDTVRKGDWWLSYAYLTGGFTTVVVPTLCKRLDRLKLLADNLGNMSCVREVMITTAGPCVAQVHDMLRLTTPQAANMTTVADMGEWDTIYGPASRFLAARRASGTVLVHLDDDEFPCERQLCLLAAKALKEPIGIYGQHKRTCTEERATKFGAICDGHTLGHAPSSTCCSHYSRRRRVRSTTPSFATNDNYATTLASTRGNGEDIAYSHFLLRFYNRTPTFVQKYPCNRWEVNGTSVMSPYFGGFSKLDDHAGMSDRKFFHYMTRRRLCRMLWNRTSWTIAVGHRAPQLVPTTKLTVDTS